MDKMKDLENWLSEISYSDKYFKKDSEEGEGTKTGSEFRRTYIIYTDSYQYSIYSVDRSKDDGYLGCISTTRKFRAGEDWRRGKDLPDGPFTYETWKKIKDEILKNELVQISEKVCACCESSR